MPLSMPRAVERDESSDGSRRSRMTHPPSRSPAALVRLRVKNRRKRYLDMHPEYFSSPSLELADPLSYDRLVRRFQSAAEREAEGRKKGYSGMLEADLWRSEAKVEALKNPSTVSSMTYRRGKGGEIVAEENDEVPKNKHEGLSRWRKQMELMFLQGDDQDFDYQSVDQSEDYDDRGLEEREVEEGWFGEQEPEWVKDSEATDQSRALTGQTGIQDF